PTDTTAMPAPKSMSWFPSASTRIPPPARSMYTGSTAPTPAATAAILRACSSTDLGPGIAVFSTRFCSTVIDLPPGSPRKRGAVSWGVSLALSLLDDGDDVAFLDHVAWRDGDLADHSIHLGQHGDLHLHRLEQHQGV